MGAGMTTNDSSILCVDDNRFVLDALSDCLKKAGHPVMIAHDGFEALGMFRRAVDSIRLVVADVEMPQMSGVELANLIKDAKHNCSVLLISGAPLPPEAKGLDCAFLHKPFAPGALVETVEGMLAGAN